MSLTELAEITKSIISSQGIQEHVNAVKKLSAFYNRATADNAAFNLSPDNEKYIKGGQALSTYHAAVCTDDYLRTCYFIKGVYRAINKLLLERPDKKINIIYAGCGPFATLLLPILPLLDRQRIQALVLDINTFSIQSVSNLITITGLQDYDIKLIEADATTFSVPKEWEIDLFISETMHYGLTAEPQVAITKNFIPQLSPHSIFIPNQIHIDLVYTFYGKEPFIRFKQNPAESTLLQAVPDRLKAGRLFSINRDISLPDDNRIISDYYSIPEDISATPDMCVFTEVEIYEGLSLKTAESVLTNPYCITSLHHLKDRPGFQLIYDFNETPGWAYIVK